MATPFSITLLERFQQNGLMRLQPEQFLLVVRRMGANFSAKECASVVKHVGTDAQGFVNIHGFCAWFENIENERRRFHVAEDSSASGAIDGVAEAKFVSEPHAQSLLQSVTGNEFVSFTQHEPLGADGGPSEIAGEADMEHNMNPDVRSEVGEDETYDRVGGLLLRPRLNLDLSVQFDPEVQADDGSVLPLDADKCTLPSHRKLSEHEILVASFRSDLAEVKTRLESGPVEYRADLR
eukprot:TRINITY_DN10785_c0_g1_i1.p1 TRINITY_DN10785_c0_g1~~TRINITY_DN10785_c0_g1_i1.p1  ORF type:complete len:260 (+),score=45.73 TRINITY_DN10785_c0_g1_i1:70-780(+)